MWRPGKVTLVSDLPRCRNYKENSCERSDQVILRETEEFWHFYCRTCKSDWIVTKPRTRARAQYEAQASRLGQATQSEKQRLVFGRHYGGVRHG